ncbi:MAG: VOC family protein [Thermoplasmata archaeon]|jgi:catechol 2,3-dioxygenase-like lactoylglutathione lyase family enzyme
MTSKTPPRDFGLIGIDHADLLVSDLAKAVRFFTEQMGMSLMANDPSYAVVQCGEQTLGLRSIAPGSARPGTQRIALRVDEWMGLRSRVMRSRAVIQDEREDEAGRTLRIRGPDGLQIDLVWRA